ncbi:hypothetical protein JCM13210_01590 [Thermaerobacter litoralis]
MRQDPDAYDRLVHRYQSRVTATVVIDGQVFRGFGRNREAIQRALQGAGRGAAEGTQDGAGPTRGAGRTGNGGDDGGGGA